MADKGAHPSGTDANRMTMKRTSERELVVTRRIRAEVGRVYGAWTDAAVFQRWWVPASVGMTLLACTLDVRVGGGYRLVFRHPASPEPMAFHGKYLEVVPPTRMVWTNDEGGDNAQVTTVHFEDDDGQTLLTIRDLYPTKEALDDELASESVSWNDETFSQLDALLSGDGDM